MRDIKNIVEKLIKQYKTNNVYELISILNIKVFELPFEQEIGMYRFIKNNRVIIISQNLNEITKKFILSHELGHAILHRKENCFYLKHNTFSKVSSFEIEANKFAAELLIPDDELNICIENNFTIEQASQYFKVPIDLIKLKRRI